jgi:hypothetical protein
MVAWIAWPIAGAILGTAAGKKFFPEATWGESIGMSLTVTALVSTIRLGPKLAATRGLSIARFLFPFVRVPVAFLFKDLIFPVARPIGMGFLRGGAALMTSTTAAYTGAAVAGYVIGAITGTVIVSQMEKRGIVYAGATTDVKEFYKGRGDYWGEFDWKGTPKEDRLHPAGIDESGPGIVPEKDRPGYFNVPGNLRIIGRYYWDRATD